MPVARAQQAPLLRGVIDNTTDTNPASVALPKYQPISQGALPDTTASASPTTGDTAASPAGSTNNTDLSLPTLNSGTTTQPTASTTKKPLATKIAATTTAATEKAGVDNLRTQSIDAAQTTMGRVEPENQREQAAGGHKIKPDTDPYAALGIRFGSFLLRPSFETGLRSTTNADVSSTGTSAVLSESTLRLDATSDWSRHQASLQAYGTFLKTLSGQKITQPEVGITGSLRLDLADQTTVTATAGYNLHQESANTPNSVAGTTSQPSVQTFDASLAAEHDLGLLYFRTTGAFERQVYGDASLSTGGTLSQSDRNTKYGSFTLRGGINVSPALKPFVEIELGRLLYDDRYDASGYQRSADRLGLRGGLTFDFGEKLNGEVSAGYLAQRFDDPRLKTLSSPSITAKVNWSPQRGTNVALTGSTTLEGSTTAGDSGSVLYSSSVAVTHSLRPNLDLTTTLGAWLRDLKTGGNYDYGMSAEVGTVYWFNRFVGLDTSARYEVAESADPGRRAKAASVFVGLKVQR